MKCRGPHQSQFFHCQDSCEIPFPSCPRFDRSLESKMRRLDEPKVFSTVPYTLHGVQKVFAKFVYYRTYWWPQVQGEYVSLRAYRALKINISLPLHKSSLAGALLFTHRELIVELTMSRTIDTSVNRGAVLLPLIREVEAD